MICLVDVTAKQISEWALASIARLSRRPDIRTLTAAYRTLSRESGLSESWIAKFYQGAKPNPTQETLDSLVAAIKVVDAKKVA